MKINVNPIDVMMQSRVSILRKQLFACNEMLDTALFSMKHMQKVCKKIYNALKGRSFSSTKVSAYIATLEGIVNSCEYNRVKLLTGTYTRNSSGIGHELWYQNGFHYDYRNRLYLPDVQLKKIGLENVSKLSKAMIKTALKKLQKAIADVSANKLVIEQIIFYNKKNVASKDAGFFLEDRTGFKQVQFLQAADWSLLCIKKIINSLELLHIKAKQNPQNEVLYQVEVSSLVDELDRVVSHTSFNQMKLLTGYFSKNHPHKRELWFIAPDHPKDRKRLYLNTMHALALHLKEKNYAPIAISNTATEKKLHTALQRVALERDKIKTYIDYFNKQSAFKQISIF